MKTKKLLALFLAILMIAATMPMAFAAENDISNGMYSQYQFFEEGIEGEGYIVGFLNTTYDGLGLKDFDLAWTIIEGELPEGLELVATDRELIVKGTATELGSYIITVALTATGTDGTVYTGQKVCEIEVIEQYIETKISRFFAGLAPEVSMSDAATVDEVIAWANNTWLPGLEGLAALEAEAGAEISITSTDWSEEVEYTAPIAGDANDPDGTDGSLKAYVTINAEEPYYLAEITIIIKATPWSEPADDDTPPAETPNKRCCLCDCYESIMADPGIPSCFKQIFACFHKIFHSTIRGIKDFEISC